MEPVLVHEYFRILVPALVFVGIFKLLLPSAFPENGEDLLILAVGIGLLASPVFDRLAKKFFHRQVTTTKFYETFIESFFRHYRIAAKEDEKLRLRSFSGPLKMAYSAEAETMIEVYKLFSRQGWGTEEEKYRVRMEKSFGILYYGIFCYACVAFAVSLSEPIIRNLPVHPILRYWYADALLFLTLMAIALWESRCRFRASLENEALILRGHFKELKEYYDDRCIPTSETSGTR
jgi:hypothetical protein